MIIKVGGPGNISGASPIKKKDAKKTTGNFSAFLSAEEAAETKHSSGVTASGIIGAMLAMEQEQSATEKPLRRGYQILEHLDEIRYALLAGGIPEGAMRRLKEEVTRERGEVVDPKLLEILNEIETRAAVELAKLEVAKNQ